MKQLPTECKRGHKFTGAKYPTGRQRCVICYPDFDPANCGTPKQYSAHYRLGVLPVDDACIKAWSKRTKETRKKKVTKEKFKPSILDKSKIFEILADLEGTE